MKTGVRNGAAASALRARASARILGVLLSLLVLVLPGGCENPAEPFLGLTATSSRVLGHTHSATVRGADISDPPSSVEIRTTTAGNAAQGVPDHSHTVTLLQSDLTVLQQNGGSVEVGTSRDAGHEHVFVFTR